MLFLYIVIGVAVIFFFVQLFTSERKDAEGKLSEAKDAAVAGAVFSTGCLMQCIFAAIPVIIGIILIRGCS